MTFLSTIYSKKSTFSRFNLDECLSDVTILVKEFKQRVLAQLKCEENQLNSLPLLFDENRLTRSPDETAWLENNTQQFFTYTPNEELEKRYYLLEMGFITTIVFSPDGEYIIVGHSTGLIQMRHGHTGSVLATLRNIQYPPRPVYALEFSKTEDRICYAACTDGGIYRVEVPQIDTTTHIGAEYCIKIDPRMEWLNTVFFGSPGQCLNATPFITQRTPVLSISLTADGTNIIAGYSDSSIKVFDINTQSIINSYKVHKVRLQFIPKKMQRVHSNQVVAVRCHEDIPTMFASAAWDASFRIWDTRCLVGCMATFEDVDIVHDALDLNRNQAITGSWTTTEGLSLWDLTAKKRLSIVRVQNRRPDVDGDYFYTCRYWKSSKYNRKGKYGIVGGSGTGCLEVINLHNRYITGSFPAPGSVLAVSSYEDRIAFGGTAPIFNIVSFHDPKHEPYAQEIEAFQYSEHPVVQLDQIVFPTPDVSVPDPDSEKTSSESEGAKAHKKKFNDHALAVPRDISRVPIKKVKPKRTVSKLKPPPTQT